MTPAHTRYMQKSTVTASITTMMDLPTVDHQDGRRQNFFRRRMRTWCLWCGVGIACSGPANLILPVGPCERVTCDGSGSFFPPFCDGSPVNRNRKSLTVFYKPYPWSGQPHTRLVLILALKMGGRKHAEHFGVGG